MTAVPAPVAIIGMSCRAPGADTLDELWRVFADGQRRIGPVPSARWAGLDFGRWPEPRAALLATVDRFDAAFFGIPPRMAAWLDPQQRMLLELAWQALENAGQDPESLAGERVGVWVGAFLADYRERMSAAARSDAAAFPGTLAAYAANRLSYQFDWTGPSMVLDTACASGLTALAAAITSIRGGECPMALVAAPSVGSAGFYANGAFRGGALSPSGASIPFAAERDGYVRGEGGACVVLKRLDLALAAGDPVHAVVRGVGVAHNGRGGGLTGTDTASQVRLIRETAESAGCGVAELGYLEAHGTGTPGGDRAELAAVAEVLGGIARPGGPGGRLWVGSLKANLGHLEAAAGLLGLIKSVLVLNHGLIPRIAGLTAPDPGLPTHPALALAVRDAPWPPGPAPRLAAVNAFGLGGTLTHAIVEEAPARDGGGGPDQPCVVPLSAGSPHGLRSLAQRLRRKLEAMPPPSLRSVAWTLQNRPGRRVRRAAVVGSMVELAGLLEHLAADRDDRLPQPGAVGDGGLDSIATRWQDGEPVDWAARWRGALPDRVALPSAPFEGKSHWFDEHLPGEARPD
ncbi:beta-ketoacyl synthase N-terminal-like domain-containing protein [Amycolatopsis magusensis]|uniref:polyketide synthase n=1 Tax=Amycolatopsis magusensis TaxID=882444 RepID=UPI003C2C9F76